MWKDFDRRHRPLRRAGEGNHDRERTRRNNLVGGAECEGMNEDSVRAIVSVLEHGDGFVTNKVPSRRRVDLDRPA